MEIFVYRKGAKAAEEGFTKDELPDLIADETNVVWVDLQGENEEQIEEAKDLLQNVFKFHPLTIEDCVEIRNQPKIEAFSQYLFLIVHGIRPGETGPSNFATKELDAYLGTNDVVTFLNGLFTRFDVAANDLGIEKIKTVGDAYMAVCGLPVPVDNHAERMVRMAIRMVHITREHAMEHNVSMKLRVGVNSGPVVAGVIGKSKYIYDLWGDTVNLASRMESGGIPDAVQVTRPVYEQLKEQFVFEARGTIEVKGKGSNEAWLLRL